MNNRSKSQRIIHLSTLLAEKEEDLNHLQSKVDRSVPILQTIYSKIKKREEKFSIDLKNKEQKLKKVNQVSNQYKKLYESGLRIMNRNKIIDKFTGKTNYRTLNDSNDKNHEEFQISTFGENPKYSRYRQILNRKPFFNEQQKKQSISVYEQYKQKIKQIPQNKPSQTPQISSSLRFRAQALQKIMANQLESLRLTREKSQHQLKKMSKCSSSKHSKSVASIQQIQHQDAEKKEKYLKMQKIKMERE